MRNTLYYGDNLDILRHAFEEGFRLLCGIAEALFGSDREASDTM